MASTQQNHVSCGGPKKRIKNSTPVEPVNLCCSAVYSKLSSDKHKRRKYTFSKKTCCMVSDLASTTVKAIRVPKDLQSILRALGKIHLTAYGPVNSCTGDDMTLVHSPTPPHPRRHTSDNRRNHAPRPETTFSKSEDPVRRACSPTRRMCPAQAARQTQCTEIRFSITAEDDAQVILFLSSAPHTCSHMARRSMPCNSCECIPKYAGTRHAQRTQSNTDHRVRFKRSQTTATTVASIFLCFPRSSWKQIPTTRASQNSPRSAWHEILARTT